MCDFPKCKEHAEMRYLHKEMCKKHWYQLCDIWDLDFTIEKNVKKENKLLKQIGLCRNEDGLVLPI